MKRTRYVLGALVALGLTVPAAAQTPNYRQVSGSYYDIWPKNPTYHVGFVFTPAATPTDVFTLQAGTGKSLSVNRVECNATATTAGFMPMTLVSRTTLDTGGTSTALTPAIATASDGASTAKALLFSANPTALGTTAGTSRAAYLAFPTASSGFGPLPVTWPFGLVYSTKRTDSAKNTTQNIALNFGGAAVPAGGSVACSVEWSEY